MISIIVPVYNSEEYLNRCLNSILSQTYSDFEILLIDDASKDRSLSICRKYESKYINIRALVLPHNSGQVTAYLEGIKKSKGDFIGFVDSDDWIEPEMFNYLMHSLEENNSDIATCGVFIDFPDHSIVEPNDIYNYDGLTLNKIQIRQQFKELHTKNNAIDRIYKLYRYNKLYKKEIALKSLKYLQPDIRVFEDNNFVIPCLLNSNNISYVGQPLYHYVRRQNSTMSSFDKSIIASNRNFLKNQAQLYRDMHVDHDMCSDAYVTSTFSLNKILLSDLPYKQKKQLLLEVKKDFAQYKVTKKKSLSFGASKNVAFMIDLIEKGCITIALAIGLFYKHKKKREK